MMVLLIFSFVSKTICNTIDRCTEFAHLQIYSRIECECSRLRQINKWFSLRPVVGSELCRGRLYWEYLRVCRGFALPQTMLPQLVHCWWLLANLELASLAVVIQLLLHFQFRPHGRTEVLDDHGPILDRLCHVIEPCSSFVSTVALLRRSPMQLIWRLFPSLSSRMDDHLV